MLNSEEQAQFAQLQALYIDSLPGKKAELHSALEQVRTAPDEGLRALKVQAHRIAGSGGGYGFPELSELARALELQIIAQLERQPLSIEPIEQALEQLLTLMDRLYQQRQSNEC
ncbi:MAG: Hpt domain-containing protein [Chromatiales bacterium]|nr:Hpt domain-containing protein [Chromatiales bacterium]